MPNTSEIMELQKLAGMDKFSKRTVAEELERSKIIELLRDVQYLGGLEEKVADHLIANGVTVQQWISVKERLPEKEGTYIVHGNLGGVFGLFYDEILADSFKQMVTHWMPLPQPPKGE